MRTPRIFTLRLESNRYGLRKYAVLDHHGNIAGSIKIDSHDAPALEASWHGPKALDGAGLTSPLAGGHRSQKG